MRSPVGAVLLVGLLLAVRAGAQQYDLRTFSLEQGLPSAAVNAICEDADGFLWVATDQGLARSQGSRFEAFDERQGAPHAEATALFPVAPAGGNGLWAGYRSGALARWNNGRLQPLKTTPQLPPHPVGTLLAGPGNTLWLGSLGSGVWLVDTAALTCTPVNDGLLGLQVNALVSTPDLGLLAGTDSGLFQLTNHQWRLRWRANQRPGTGVLSLFADGMGLLVGTANGPVELGLDFRPALPQEHTPTPVDWLRSAALSILREDGHGVWIGTPNGLLHIDQRKGAPHHTLIGEANGLGHDVVRCLHRDRSGSIWVGTAFGGVSKFTSEAFLYITERDGLGSRIVSAVHRTPDGTLWIGTLGGGLSYYDGQRMTHLPPPTGPPSPYITCLATDAQGHLLVGTATHGLHRFRAGHWEQVWSADAPQAQQVYDVATLGHGALLIAAADGLHLLQGNKRTSYLRGRVIQDLVVTTDTVWCATDKGLYAGVVADSLELQLVGGIPMVSYNALAQDSKGNLWLGTTAHGLVRKRGTRTKTYGRDAGLQSLAIECVVLDALENIWLGTKQGIHLVELDALQEQVLSIRAFGPEDGFIGLESLPGAALLDTDSSLWFGTVRGAIRYDARQVVNDPKEPLVHFTDLRLFYERPDWSPWCAGFSTNGLPNQLELPHDKNHLTFSFTGISLAYPEKVRYRWYLEGYDPDWSPITATQRVTYSNIPPGEYTFRVMARNASGIWNEAPVSYAFTIAPPFWRTTPFMASGGIALVLGLIGLQRLRERRQRQVRDRLERQVVVRTRQLAQEKERSDELLRNILPATTAEELKEHGTAEAKRHENCTVLFSDFKGFTGFSSLMDTNTLVSELDHYFRLFDEECERFGLEKIKTIGDAYMCAAGLPEPKATHARDAVCMGLAMLDAVERSNAERRLRGLTEWPVRIGIHTGPLVAGVVGRKKFAYDIWGDTVNLASRMESAGEAGKLNVSGTTYAHVMDQVHAIPRGPIKVKGKGEVHMYFVTGFKASEGNGGGS